MNPMNTKQAWLAVYARARQIRTANGYHHDLDAKAILPRLATPGGPGSPGVLPYLCIPADDDLAFPEAQEYDAAVEFSIRVPLVLFFAEKKGNGFTESTGAEAWDWLDDLMRAFMPAADSRWWDLECPAIRDVTLLKKRVAGDPGEGSGPHVSLELGISLISSRDDLAA